ncbi:hypothetical protein L198_06902 [Cryptococcus wingfieldii CBS 7118]|uniref:Cytochrome P450 n=1 Tax=Cryptococcus wingfieldii CBS 7118 TaxID=1295528 RepID=A0A1E3IGM1_9TREE|nr:hypothetical protein L198_06902 [Cryptococcus wingfieldii CBS 7118]ODN87678.1 hypothetical protein L198_06902 [Cryptococcus wingfieldii CBS 7118]
MGTLDGLTAHLPSALRDLPPLYIASTTLIALALTIYLWLFYIAYARIPFRNLPDPGPGHWLLGHVPSFFAAASANSFHVDWHKAHGHTLKYRTQLGSYEVSTIDPTAIAYILNHPDMFDKPPAVRKWLQARIGGYTIFATSGDHHKQQRKALGPSFTPAAIRDLVPVFYDVAYELKDKFHTLVAGKDKTKLAPSPPKPIDAVPGGAKINVLKYLNMATLDSMGLTGFGYAFDSLSEDGNGQKNEFAESCREFVAAATQLTMVDYVIEQYMFKIPSKRENFIKRKRQQILEFSTKLAEEKKHDIWEQTYGEGIAKKQDVGKDLLSLLIKANIASDLTQDERLDDQDVADQIETFASLILLAGSETTAVSVSTFLRLLSKHTDVQDRLRKELMSVTEDRPSPETLNNLPYLEAVTRECLRLAPAAPFVFRSAVEPVIIPLGTPMIGKDGQLMTEFTMDTASQIFLPVLAINTSTTLWGPDAETFNPDRFLDRFAGVNPKIPGIYGNLLTFLGGPRNCIGYRFAIQQIKIMLFVLLRSHEFRELKSGPEALMKMSPAVQHFIKGEEHLGAQIPLMVVPLE